MREMFRDQITAAKKASFKIVGETQIAPDIFLFLIPFPSSPHHQPSA